MMCILTQLPHRYFNAIYAIFKAFIDKRTSEKFIIVGSDYMSTLLEYIDISQIPPEMGGEATDVHWGGPFGDHTGVSDIQVKKYMMDKYKQETIHQMLRGDEIEVLKQAVQFGIEDGFISLEEVTMDISKTDDA